MLKQKYAVPKKTLQLEVRRVAQELHRLPNRDELARFGKYPIKYYDKYFASWGEVCAAARTTGMTEDRLPNAQAPSGQMHIFRPLGCLSADIKPLISPAVPHAHRHPRHQNPNTIQACSQVFEV